MVWNFLKGGSPQAGQVELGAFGKIPSMGDFVRVGCKPLASFESWVESGMAQGEAKLKDRWPDVYAKGQLHGFVFRGSPTAKETQVMSGTIGPSFDAVGRRFPLIIFSSYSEKRAGHAGPLAPLFLGDFLADAAQTAREGTKLASGDALKERVSGISVPTFDSEASFTAEYTQWARATPARTVWQSIYSDPDTDAPLAVLKAILDSVSPFHGRENLTTLLALRLPLGGAGPLVIAFWIDVVRRAAGWRHSVPTLFWSVDGKADSLLVQLGVTPPSALAELWSPDAENDNVYDLTFTRSMDTRRQLLADLPRDIGRNLEQWDASAADLLAAIGR